MTVALPGLFSYRFFFIYSNEHVLIQGWKSPDQKRRDERVNDRNKLLKVKITK